jgi:hypothetical protein
MCQSNLNTKDYKSSSVTFLPSSKSPSLSSSLPFLETFEREVLLLLKAEVWRKGSASEKK